MPIDAQTRSDEEIIGLIKSQNNHWKALFSILINRHHNALVIRCHCYLRNRTDAEDAAQETELRAFRAVRNFRQDSSFKTWLFAIADRQCHDLNHKRNRFLLSDHLRALIEIHEESITRLKPCDVNDDLVNQVLQRLSTSEREILTLRFYSDLPMKDMAALLGIKLSATKMRLYRALEHFAGYWNTMTRDMNSTPLPLETRHPNFD